MIKFEDVEFRKTRVPVDDRSFLRCNFEQVTLEYGGRGSSVFDQCVFNDVDIAFVNEAANTLAFIKALYSSGFRPIIEATLADITKSGTKDTGIQDGGS